MRNKDYAALLAKIKDGTAKITVTHHPAKHRGDLFIQHGLKYRRYEATHCGQAFGGTFQVPDPDREMVLPCPRCHKRCVLKPVGEAAEE